LSRPDQEEEAQDWKKKYIENLLKWMITDKEEKKGKREAA